MTNITEDYCSFDIAKLLKEKGFVLPSTDYRDWICCMYDNNGDITWGCYSPDWYVRATIQMAMKWLREVHNIFIAINMIPDTIQKPYFFKPYVDGKIYNFPLNYSVEFYATYEEACESAIKYCLENLI